MKGDVPAVCDGTILGHEGIGVVEETGSAVNSFKKGDRVIISCITSCGKCANCRKAMYSHCELGGWILGNLINGCQAEYVRIPFADTSLYPIPPNADEDAMVMLSDILPTGFECGVLNGNVKPGDTVAIIGAGPIGLAALLTVQFFSPAAIILIDLDDNRLEKARASGATHTINSSRENALEQIMKITHSKGVDTAIEAVGAVASFDLCQSILCAGGRLANIGVHGKPVTLHLEKLWSQNITLTTQLVDTSSTPMLLKTVLAEKLNPLPLISHHFKMNEIMEAYSTFEHAVENKSLKVILSVTTD